MSDYSLMARKEAEAPRNMDEMNSNSPVHLATGASSARGLALLALDGGGVRGISELYVLEQLMVRLQRRQNLPKLPKPCDVFDIIAGTSTGGLIAIMLGRLNMEVSECQKAYSDFAEEVFGKPNHIPVFKDGIFKAANLEKVIKDIVGNKNLGTKMMNSPDRRCRVFVCACSTADTRGCRLFRTYEHDNIMDDCEIWEAARATSAAPKFFKRAEITPQSGVKETFVDGGFGWNNPALELCEEARVVFPNQKIDCIISIGTGTQPSSELSRPKWWQTRLALYVIPTVISITTDCDKNHVHMSRKFRHIPNIYFRFDVDGMGQVGLEEWKSLGDIRSMTMAYLQKEDINQSVDRAVGALYMSLSRPNAAGHSFRENTTSAAYATHGQRGTQFARTVPLNLEPEMISTAFREPRSPQNPNWSHGLGRTEENWSYSRQGRGRDMGGEHRVGVESNDYEQQQGFLRALKVDPDTIFNVKDQKDIRFEDTCEWILEKQSYRDWIEGSGSKVLIITAPPGQGKSVLAKYVLETFKRSITELGDFVVIDYFCQGTRENRTTAVSIVQSLLYQLLAERRHLFGLVPQQYMKFMDREQELPFETLWKIFASILKSAQIAEAYCLIDGLDECEPESDRILLKAIENSFTPQGNNRVPSSNRIRFLITSRPTTPATRLGRLSHLCEIQKSDLDKDIQKVIDFRLQKLSRTHELRPTVSGIINLVLSGSANGMFLWVVLSLDQLEAIQVGLSEFQVVEKLDEIPKSIQEVYSEAVRRIKEAPETRELAKKILDILMFSFIHLPVRALATACCDWPDTCATHSELLSRIPDNFGDSAKTACGSLIRFVDGTIQFCHHTASQYLISPDTPVESFSFNPDHIHCDLARICIRYLLLEGVSVPETTEEEDIIVDGNAFPLLEYALRSWSLHLRQSKMALEQYPGLLVRFFDSNSRRFKECLRPWSYLRKFSPEDPVDTDSLVLHALTYFRLDNLIARMYLAGTDSVDISGCRPADVILELRTHVNATNTGKFTPLMLAAYNSSLSTTEGLLKLGADPNLVNDDGRTALHIASRGVGPEDLGLVKCLIPKTLCLTTTDKEGYPPFLLTRDKEIAEAFLDSGIHVDSVNEINDMTLLEYAAWEGNAELVETLLNRGANVNHRSKNNWTALYAAARCGSAETIRLLIGRGADIQAESEKGWNALHEVAFAGSSEAIQLLLNYGINKESVVLDGSTAILLAASEGNEEAVETLLHAGADPNACNDNGDSALLMAASKGRDGIVQKLIDNQAKVNAVGRNGSTPLENACEGNHLSTAKLLLENGADKNYNHPERIPMLQMAIYNDYLELAEYLIKAGIDLGSTFKSNYTPLYVAVWMNRPRIAKILLEKGANIHCHGENGISVLHQCAYHGQQELLGQFLEDIDVNIMTNQHVTPLHAAAEEGHLAVVKQLLMARAEVNGADLDGFTPLFIAALNGHLEVVEGLLKAGANLEAVGGPNASPPLFAAANKGHFQLVMKLLEAGADAKYRSKSGASLLHLVAEFSTKDAQLRSLQVDITKKLFQEGANADAVTEDGNSPLLAACYGENLEVFNLILSHCSDMNCSNKNGYAAIHAAARNGNLLILNRLLEGGADGNMLDNYRRNPLTFAAHEGHLPIVVRLLEAGADANVLDDQRWSPLMHAAHNGKTEMVRYLLQAQSNPNQVNDMLETPLHAATYFYWQSTMEILLENGANPWALDSFGKTAVEWANLNKQTIDIMKKRNYSFQATSEEIRTSRLRLSVRLSVERTISGRSKGRSRFGDLGQMLIKLNEVDDACTAFEQLITEKDHVWFNSTCCMCGIERMGGKRFVCKICAVMDLCRECMGKYETGSSVRGCVGHEFLEIPRPEWNDFAPGVVNKDRETGQQWIKRLYETYQDARISPEEARAIGYEGRPKFSLTGPDQSSQTDPQMVSIVEVDGQLSISNSTSTILDQSKNAES